MEPMRGLGHRIVMMRRILLSLLLAVLALPFLASPCWACSCARLSPRAQARAADVVFTGTVAAASIDAGVTVARFALEESFKGSPAGEIAVRTPAHATACGVTLHEGMRYTVFALDEGAGLETNSCIGTARGTIDPARFGLDGGQPAASDEAPSQAPGERGAKSPASSSTPWVLIAVVVAVAGGLLWLGGRSLTSARREERGSFR